MRLPRWFHLLGSPPFVYGLAGRRRAVARCDRGHLVGRRRVLGTGRRAARSRSRRGLSDPLYAPASRLHQHDGVRRHGGVRRDRLRLADQARARGGRDGRADRRDVHGLRSRDRRDLGSAYMGHVLAVDGPADHVRDIVAVLVLELSRAARRVRRPRQGGSGERDPRGRRRRQRADHSLLGNLVELAASRARRS